MCENCNCKHCVEQRALGNTEKRKDKRVRRGKMCKEQRTNAEFKHLKLRIRKLEQIVLGKTQDNGSITEPAQNISKG